MPYLNVDDEFPEHPKIDALSDGAFRLQVSGMAYCAKKLTDGRVPRHRVHRLTPSFKPSYLKQLIKAGVWHNLGEGCGNQTCPEGESDHYVIHDYLEWNKSRAWWEDRRAKEAARIAEWRENKKREGAA